MANDLITTVLSTFVTGSLIIGFAIRSGNTIPCHVFKFLLFPTVVHNASFLKISVDKVIAVTYLLKHKRMMTPRVIAGIIVFTWVVAMLLFVCSLFNVDGYITVAQYGTVFQLAAHSLK